MRITTNAILRNYRSNLGASITNLDVARTKVMTGRQFVSAAENPAAAMRSNSLFRRLARTEDYLITVQDVQSFQDTQEDALMQMGSMVTTLTKQYGMEALNGTNMEPKIRHTFADAFRGAQENLLLALNASYEGKYVFAGNDGLKPPFTWGKDKKTLLYRGLDVNDPNNQQQLENLSKEASFVDLGFGMEGAEKHDTDPSSAFDTSLPGIKFAGYGTTPTKIAGNAPGTNPPAKYPDISNNIVLLTGQIAEELEKPEGEFNPQRLEELLDNLSKKGEDLLSSVTTLGTKTEFLTTSKERLDTDRINLMRSIDQLVNVDMAGAISEFSWAQYAYNAALKVGTNILAPSFIDFMK